MIHTQKVQILSVDILSVFVRVPLLLFLMASGSISLIMMPLPNLSSLWREIPGMFSKVKPIMSLCLSLINWKFSVLTNSWFAFLSVFLQVCWCSFDNTQGNSIPHVWYESGIQPWTYWTGNVLRTYGWWSAYWAIRWYVGWLVCEGNYFDQLFFCLYTFETSHEWIYY